MPFYHVRSREIQNMSLYCTVESWFDRVTTKKTQTETAEQQNGQTEQPKL